MEILNLKQGSKEWHEFRAGHFTASDAAAMLGCSPYKTRDQLLQEKVTGIVEEITDPVTLGIFKRGHDLEAKFRPEAEKIVDDELYPVTGRRGRLAASFDGLTMDGSVCFEHKTLNKTLAKCEDGASLPSHIKAQIEHQLIVSNASKCLFAASNDQNSVSFWYESEPELREKILVGWAQFELDMQGFVPKAVEAKPVPVVMAALPALNIQINGAVTASNLNEFRENAIARFDAINTDLSTDQDFADAEEAVKWLREVEQKLKTAKEHAISQTADIERLFIAIDEISETARKKRLHLDKLVKEEKENIRASKVYEANQALVKYVSEQAADIPFAVDLPRFDFGLQIKGLRTITSVDSALSTYLANCKIEVSQIVSRCRDNLKFYGENAEGFEGLFPDLSNLINRSAEDFELAVKGRIHEQKQRQAEYERIQAERQALRRAQEAQAQAQAQAQEPQVQAQEVQQAQALQMQQESRQKVQDVKALALIEREYTVTGINRLIEPIKVSAALLAQHSFEPTDGKFSAQQVLEIMNLLERAIQIGKEELYK